MGIKVGPPGVLPGNIYTPSQHVNISSFPRKHAKSVAWVLGRASSHLSSLGRRSELSNGLDHKHGDVDFVFG